MEKYSWEDNIGTIKEIYEGHYQIILDFATNNVLKYFLNDNYKMVWVYKHWLQNHSGWDTYNLPLTDSNSNLNVLARNIEFDFIMPTKEFRYILPNISQGINLIQLNKLPNYYLDLAKIKGKTLYDLLQKECNYLFEVNIRSVRDYGTLISPDKNWLQSLLNNKEINWTNLP
jgi:hypothetical protein